MSDTAVTTYSGDVERLPAAHVDAREPMTPMLMLQAAVERGASLETLEKLMTLQERFEANQARKAFDDAMAAAKAEIPIIAKNREVDFTSSKGRTHYRHEDLAEIARTVNPILARFGLSYRFRSTVDGSMVTVTCVVSHRAGYFEENTLTAAKDESGSKNSIQAVGSALTYLQRMTLKASLGLAASDDDDGRASSQVDPGTVSDDQIDVLRRLIVEAKADIGRFLEAYKVESLEDLPVARFAEAVGKLERKRAQIAAAQEQSQQETSDA